MNLSTIALIAKEYSSLITAIATASLAIITYKYIQEIQKERKGRVVELLTHSVFYPLFLQMEEEIKKLENHFIISIRRKTEELPEMVYLGIGNTSQFLERHEYSAYRTMILKTHKSKMEELDKKYGESIDALKKLIRDVAESLPKSFINTVASFEDEFEKECQELTGRSKDELEEAFFFLKLIIEGREQRSNAYTKFWAKYRDKIKAELLKDDKIRDKLNRIKEKRREVLELAKEYKNTVWESIESWIEDYDLVIPKEEEFKTEAI